MINTSETEIFKIYMNFIFITNTNMIHVLKDLKGIPIRRNFIYESVKTHPSLIKNKQTKLPKTSTKKKRNFCHYPLGYVQDQAHAVSTTARNLYLYDTMTIVEKASKMIRGCHTVSCECKSSATRAWSHSSTIHFSSFSA